VSELFKKLKIKRWSSIRIGKSERRLYRSIFTR